MEREVKENLDSILEILEKNFSQEGVFEHILKQIEKHIDELRELKSSGGIHLYAEVADLLLLSKVLIELEEIPERLIKERSRKFLSKVRNIYGERK